MKHYETTFFIDKDDEGPQIFVDRVGESYPITLHINSGSTRFDRPSVTIFLNTEAQLDKFLKSVERECKKLAQQDLIEQAKNLSSVEEITNE